MPGVGTNRYAYSFNDPVNGSDPSGNDRIAPSGWNADTASWESGAYEIGDEYGGGFSYNEGGGSDSWSGTVVGGDHDADYNGVHDSYQTNVESAGNVVAVNFNSDGTHSVYTQNSPITRHDFALNGDLVASVLVRPTLTGGKGLTLDMINPNIETPWSSIVGGGATGGARRVNPDRPPLPQLDPSGKIHTQKQGGLPSLGQLRQYPNNELREFRHDLRISVQTRKEKNKLHGPDRGHSQRLNDELDLLRSLNRMLD